jgi:hypothetical protein
MRTGFHFVEEARADTDALVEYRDASRRAAGLAQDLEN